MKFIFIELIEMEDALIEYLEALERTAEFIKEWA